MGEVTNLGPDDASSVKVSGIFYDKKHNVLGVDCTYTKPDTIGSHSKAPFGLSFYSDNAEKVNSIALNAQNNEYSLMSTKSNSTG